MDYTIKETLAFIEGNLPELLTAQDLAESINLSASRFQHLFKQETGTSLIEYLKNLRLQKAKELLETSHLRVEEIKIKVGAADSAHFSRDFERKFGETPAEYRKKYRNSSND